MAWAIAALMAWAVAMRTCGPEERRAALDFAWANLPTATKTASEAGAELGSALTKLSKVMKEADVEASGLEPKRATKD